MSEETVHVRSGPLSSVSENAPESRSCPLLGPFRTKTVAPGRLWDPDPRVVRTSICVYTCVCTYVCVVHLSSAKCPSEPPRRGSAPPSDSST